MVPHITNWREPPKMEPGAPTPCLFIGKSKDLFCAYYISPDNQDVSSGKVAVLRFITVLQHRFGYPNDEVLHSHFLYRSGLQHYDFHIVENSPLIAEIEEHNRVHLRHKSGMYKDRFKHFIITFHDETLEVVARAGIVAARSDSPPDRAVIEFGASLGEN